MMRRSKMSYRREIDIISEIESVKPNHPASKFVERVFDDVLVSYKHGAYHSIYHDYVRLNGYPLPKEIAENKFYLPRKNIEADFRKQVKSNKNILVLGCEGSGKTTLIHRVLGTSEDSKRFLYVDTSDLEVPVSEDFFLSALVSRLVETVTQVCDEKERANFESWIKNVHGGDSLKKAQFSNERPEHIFQNYIFWLNVIQNKQLYFVLDNIDSLSVDAGRSVFSYLNQLNTSLDKKTAIMGLHGRPPLLYIVSCRTTTYEHIASISIGMFLNSEPELIMAEDEIRERISVPRLMERFLVNENEERFNLVRNKTQYIPIFHSNSTMQISFAEYICIISQWLLQWENEVNAVIKPFCGRSIRRMKIYGLRAYASPLIAMLAYLEAKNVIGITRNDPKYLKRRLLESLFDFRVVGKIDNSISVGFPVNIFRVIVEDDEFRRNPLLGVTAISLLSDNWEQFAAQDVQFAKCMHAEPFVNTLVLIGYTEGGIRDLMMTFSLAGILRPVPSSGIFWKGEGDSRDVYGSYIVDDRAVATYFSLICCDEIERSVQYFNAAVRLRYGCGSYALIDNHKYECLLNLVFISDIIKREKQLAKMNRNSGVLIKSFSSRIRGRLIPFWKKRILFAAHDYMDRQSGGGGVIESLNKRLHSENEKLFKNVSNEIATLESVI